MNQCLCTSSRDEILQCYCCRWMKYVNVSEISPWRTPLSYLPDCLPAGAGPSPEEGKKSQVGVGLAVCKSISRAEARSPEFISDRLLKVTLELCDRGRAMTFVLGYAPTDTQSDGKKHACWTALGRIVKELPENGQLFVLMYANARTGRRGGRKLGSEKHSQR